VPKVAGLAAGGDGSLWASTGDICEASSLLGVKHTNQNLVMREQAVISARQINRGPKSP
jgi:hypothetical protein